MSESGPDLESVSSIPKLLIIIGILGWIVTFLTAAVEIPIEGWAGLLIGSWIVVPAAMIWDARLLRARIRWPRFLWLYLLGALIWFLAVVPATVYLLKRRSALRSPPEKSETDTQSRSTAPKYKTDTQLRPTTPRQVVGLLAVITGNLAPLVGVAVFEWSVVPLLVIYFCEAFVTALLAAVKMLFAELGSPTENMSTERLPLVALRRKRGSLTVRAGWPPIYPRNIPFSALMYSLWLIIGLPVGLLAWATLNSPPVLSAGMGISLAALLATRLGEFRYEFIGDRRFADISAREIGRVPAQQVFGLLLIIPFATDLSKAGPAVLGTIVALRTVSEAYRYSVDRSEGPPVTLFGQLQRTQLIQSTQTRTAPPDVSVPAEPIEGRIRPNTAVVLLGSIATVFFELLNRLGFGVIAIFGLVVLTGVPALIAVYGISVMILLMAYVGSHYLRYGTVEYRRRGNQIIAYDRLLETPQWSARVYGGDFSVANAILDRVFGTGTLTGTAEAPEDLGAVRLGPVDSLSDAVETLALPITDPSRPDADYAVAAAAAGLFGIFASVPVLILVTGNADDAIFVTIIFVFGAPIFFGALGWAALSRI
ncbi:MAG: hypothetical protein J07HR59_00963, partial [Halorubrum sp. J07HR59]